MANMSCYRFKSTVEDLEDCLSVLENRGCIESESERYNAEVLIKKMFEFINQEFAIKVMTDDIDGDIQDIVGQCDDGTEEEEEE